MKGRTFSADSIVELVSGLENIDALKHCQAVISGYQGSAEQCHAVMNAVTRVKQHNAQALYVCDPVMGSPEKGCIVPAGVTQHLVETLMPAADVIVPNQFELGHLEGRPP